MYVALLYILLPVIFRRFHAAGMMVHSREGDPGQLNSVHIRGAPYGGVQQASGGANVQLDHLLVDSHILYIASLVDSAASDVLLCCKRC
jgi:hypothetical protein